VLACNNACGSREYNRSYREANVAEREPGSIVIRPARAGEDVLLTSLALRSVQQTWNYPQEFMEWEPETINVVPEHILEMTTNVLEEDGRAVGFYVLNNDLPEIELSRMMIEPDRTGNGFGRLLWNHAVEAAAALGALVMIIDSDPNAEGFYQRMGAETVGDHDWTPPMMPDWRVKKMRLNLRG
jgi:GNAT superfamily N-acetyltransferase